MTGRGAGTPGGRGDSGEGEHGKDAEDGAALLARYGAALAEGIDAAVPGWVHACVTRVVQAWEGPAWGGSLAPPMEAATAEAGERARAAVMPELRRLLAADVDAQRTTPLALLRPAVAWPSAVLADAGVPPVVRDDFDAAAFPDDVYGLTPATLADIAPELADLALAWGAAKAWEHRRRHT